MLRSSADGGIPSKVRTLRQHPDHSRRGGIAATGTSRLCFHSAREGRLNASKKVLGNAMGKFSERNRGWTRNVSHSSPWNYSRQDGRLKSSIHMLTLGFSAVACVGLFQRQSMSTNYFRALNMWGWHLVSRWMSGRVTSPRWSWFQDERPDWAPWNQKGIQGCRRPHQDRSYAIGLKVN